MPSRRRRIYWDSNCWLYLISADPGKLPILEVLLSDSKNKLGDVELVTSVISKVEVAFAQSEYQGGQPDRTVEDAIDALWADTAVTLIELHDQITLEARGVGTEWAAPSLEFETLGRHSSGDGQVVWRRRVPYIRQATYQRGAVDATRVSHRQSRPHGSTTASSLISRRCRRTVTVLSKWASWS